MSERQPVARAPLSPTGSGDGIKDVWRRHGQAMFALALVVCEDADVAESVVVQAVLDACTPAGIAIGPVGRQELARYVYVLHERRRALRPVGSALDHRPDADALVSSGVAAAAELSHRQRAAIALALFGDHSYRDIASLMGESPPVVAELMRSGLLEAGRRRS